MSRFFHKNLKPDSDKNFAQNYVDHLKYLKMEAVTFFYKCAKIDTDENMKGVVNDILKRVNMFDPLRDGYDYMDEVCGATVAPTVLTIASMAMLINAVWEGVQELATKVGLAQKDEVIDYGANALVSLCIAGLLCGYAMALFLKSAISVITRPGVTVLQGFAAQDIERFYDGDSMVATINSAFSNSSL